MTAYLAHHYDLPLITVDNQHRLRYVKYEFPSEWELDQAVTKNIIRAMVPRPDVSLVTAFLFGETRNDRTFLFPPILRREVLELDPEPGDHVLVYVTSAFASLLTELRRFGRERFHVFGYDRSEQDGVLAFQPFSKQGFLRSLATAKAVIGTAGFTLISESLYLQKPYLALPMRGQFEQQLNAYQLDQLGYGKGVDEVNAEAIGDFLYRIPDYKSRLAAYQAGDNSAIKAKLDELLVDNAAEARQFHRARV
jgi:uncharacterized protein (TIGR00661 family)